MIANNSIFRVRYKGEETHFLKQRTLKELINTRAFPKYNREITKIVDFGNIEYWDLRRHLLKAQYYDPNLSILMDAQEPDIVIRQPRDNGEYSLTRMNVISKEDLAIVFREGNFELEKSLGLPLTIGYVSCQIYDADNNLKNTCIGPVGITVINDTKHTNEQLILQGIGIIDEHTFEPVFERYEIQQTDVTYQPFISLGDSDVDIFKELTYVHMTMYNAFLMWDATQFMIMDPYMVKTKRKEVIKLSEEYENREPEVLVVTPRIYPANERKCSSWYKLGYWEHNVNGWKWISCIEYPPAYYEE